MWRVERAVGGGCGTDEQVAQPVTATKLDIIPIMSNWIRYCMRRFHMLRADQLAASDEEMKIPTCERFLL